MSQKEFNAIPRQENGRFRGLILTGRAGIGKTSAVEALCDGDEKFCRIPMASRTAEDFGVIPVPDKVGVYEDENGFERSLWEIAQPLIEAQLKPYLANFIGDGYGVVLLDDVTLADPRLQSGLLELVQFGRIGDFQLGKNVLIAMTGNGTEDGCSAVEWNKALLGRSMLIEYEPDFEFWLDLDCNKNLDPTVVGFLTAFPGFFAPSSDDETCSDENGKTPSPRDWTCLGLEVAEKHDGGRNFQKSLFWKNLDSFAASCMGKKAGSAYSLYSAQLIEYPSAMEILEDPSKWKVLPEAKKTHRGAAFAIVHGVRSLVVQLNDKINKDETLKPKAKSEAKSDLTKKFCHALAAMMENDREMGAFALRFVLTNTEESDEIGSDLAKYCFNIRNIDPILKDSGLSESMASIKQLSQGLSK